MKGRTLFLVFVALVIAAAPALAFQKEGKHFGAPFTDAKKVALKDVMASAEKFAITPIKVEGEIKDVCQNKGCWLVLTDGKNAMRITFKDYGFFVPKDSAGKKVVLEGIVEKKTIDEDAARHYAEESKNKTDVSKIKGPQEVVTMVASGVEIKD